MKLNQTKSSNVIYVSPEVEVLEIKTEGLLCNSVGLGGPDNNMGVQTADPFIDPYDNFTI